MKKETKLDIRIPASLREYIKGLSDTFLISEAEVCRILIYTASQVMRDKSFDDKGWNDDPFGVGSYEKFKEMESAYRTAFATGNLYTAEEINQIHEGFEIRQGKGKLAGGIIVTNKPKEK